MDVVVSFPSKWHRAADLWQIYTQCRPVTDIQMFEISDRRTSWNEIRARIKHFIVWVPLFFGGAYVTCTYHHLLPLFITTIATLTLFSSFSPHCNPRSFYFHWIFYSFHLSSGKQLSCVFSYWVSAEGSEGCSLHTDRACIASPCYGSVVTNTNLLHPPTDLLSLQCSQFPWHAFASRKGPYIGAQLMGI